MTVKGNKITADKGMILTNGKGYTKCLYLGVNDSVDNWHEITEEEYNKIMAEKKAAESKPSDAE